MAEQLSTDPLRLPGFPSCQNSLAWGGEHLAVSAGDIVHILTPAYTKESFWHTESVRVNRFSELEWPHQELAPLGDLSIGEEQSESRVVSLAWSPPGLGLHKRSVLAVLTSNLVLSLWESNGKSGTWRRALVISEHIHNEEANSPGFKRRSQRIRAFTWLPLLTHAHAPKWGAYLLMVVNDNNLLSCLHVRRRPSPQNSYEMKTVYHYQLSMTEVLEASDEMSPLEALLIKEARVSRLVAESWEDDQEHDEHPECHPECHRIRLTFVRGADGGPPSNEAFIVKIRPAAAGVVVEDHAPTPVESAPNLDDQSVVAGLDQAVAASVQEFNEKHRLQGHVRVRYWGHAIDPTGKYVAACITLHPSNMLESVDVSKDNILVLLVATENSVRNPTPPNAEHAIRRILSWIKAHTTNDNVKSELDINLLRTAVSLIPSAFSQDMELMAWARAAEAQMLRPAGTQCERNGDTQTSGPASKDPPKHTSSSGPSASSGESCQWCGADIPLTENIVSARCSNSHIFNRCGLTFLTIQEPGISKYCARCGKEFLDASKLEAAAGPSLALALFEEFDVCPYCQGNFSG